MFKGAETKNGEFYIIPPGESVVTENGVRVEHQQPGVLCFHGKTQPGEDWETVSKQVDEQIRKARERIKLHGQGRPIKGAK